MNNANLDQTLEALNTALKDLVESASKPVAQEVTQFLEFKARKGESNTGKGIIWTGEGGAKQIIYVGNPDRIFVSESIDLHKDKNISIGNSVVVDSTSIGPGIVKSNLREVGRLQGLIVDGSVSINSYLYYNAGTDRLGIGVEEPHAGLSVADNGVEVMLGTNDAMNGMVGTFGNFGFDIVTNNTARISVKANGNIDLGSPNKNPISVKVHGKLSVGVETPDPNVDLHIPGPVRLNNKLHLSGSAAPVQGTFNVGDIVWNDSPKVGHGVGWVCLMAGSPGMWYPFGEVRDQNK